MFFDSLEALCAARGMSVYAAVTDLGFSATMIAKWKDGAEPRTSTKQKIADYFGVTVADLSDESFTPDRYTVPIYGKIACGLPIEAVENIIGTEELPVAWKKQGEFIALQVDGDSMAPRIMNGDIVIIKKTPDFADGQTCAVMVGNDATLKKVLRRGDVLTLIPLNPDFPILNFNKKEAEEQSVRVLGVAVEVRGKL